MVYEHVSAGTDEGGEQGRRAGVKREEGEMESEGGGGIGVESGEGGREERGRG